MIFQLQQITRITNYIFYDDKSNSSVQWVKRHYKQVAYVDICLVHIGNVQWNVIMWFICAIFTLCFFVDGIKVANHIFLCSKGFLAFVTRKVFMMKLVS